MSNYINGYSTPQFKIYNSSNVEETTIDLNLCGQDGLMENYEFFSTRHNLLNYQENVNWYGFHINFNLSYSEYSDKTNALKIMKLINYIMNDYRIKIIPRTDLLRRQYDPHPRNDRRANRPKQNRMGRGADSRL